MPQNATLGFQKAPGHTPSPWLFLGLTLPAILPLAGTALGQPYDQTTAPGPVTNEPLDFPSEYDECGCIDLVFLIDVTGSMEEAIANITTNSGLPAVVHGARLLSGDEPDSLRLGLITFRDEVKVNSPFTTDTNGFKQALRNLVAREGDNYPEASDEALRAMLSESDCSSDGTPDFATNGSFRPECLKHAVLITDDRPGGCDDIYDADTDGVNALARAQEAAAMDVMITAVYVGGADPHPDYTVVRIMQNYAWVTGGVYIALPFDAQDIGAAVLAALDRCGDCNSNGVKDTLDILEGTSLDCNLNGVPDECEPPLPDCNENGVPDACDVLMGQANDCNSNGISDECERDRIYVDNDATGANNGTSWEDAYVALRNALSPYPTSCAGTEIWVAEGTYYYFEDPSSLRGYAFVLNSNFAIYGGFTGNETSRSERDPQAHVTVLSGDIDRDGLPDQNAYNVVIADYVDSTLLEGFVIEAGNADGDSQNKWDIGGGLLVNGGSLTVQSCRFRNNNGIKGGGAYVRDGGDVTFRECTFEDNTTPYLAGGLGVENASVFAGDSLFAGNGSPLNAYGAGGAVVAWHDGVAHLEDCVLVENQATYGGAIESWNGGSVEAVNCTFTRNAAGDTGGAADVEHSDAAYPSAQLQLHNCVLWDNTSLGHGDELSIYTGGNSTLTVARSVVHGGYAGIYHNNGTVVYDDSNIESDPQFVGTLGEIDFSSPCVDSGSNAWVRIENTFDFFGNPRIVDGGVNGATVDMGAFEVGRCPSGILPDWNEDGLVDLIDFAALQRCFGQSWPASKCFDTFDRAAVCGILDLADYGAFAEQLLGPAALGEMMMMGGGGEGMMITLGFESDPETGSESEAPPVPEPDPWMVEEGAVTLHIVPAGGSQPVTTLEPDATYELHYSADTEWVSGFVAFTIAERSESQLTYVAPPATGPWSGTELYFAATDVAGRPPVVAEDFPPVHYRCDSVSNDVWPVESTSAGPTGHLFDFAPAHTGDLIFEFYIWQFDFKNQQIVEMPARFSVSVQPAQSDDES